ncbi:hypothetical protein AOL_s00188g153 [Orbilia oligospora ATCC 24927]|uniref:MARVEL domain-containing protein n=1 Tax=Arthrobotrys oligospora (strain ATCC 24927 / CBS 115.81 / DSM 1491) TaxID=756982 RepID=G1XQE1_ARTOA|nr:hypothetical protein AOL_s00188g153 [Orbilia oligospora ATCC 24927]EGX44485.1 hypothetical protein AOL_s00188g153 [Orbilia oligospora ATCC 24927]
MSPAAELYIPRLTSILLRLTQLLTSIIITGISGHYLNTLKDFHIPVANGRFIYTTIISSSSLIYSFICLIFWRYTVFPVDLGFFVAYLVGFGVVVSWIVDGMGCEKTWDLEVRFGVWLSGRPKDQCGRWAAVETFTFFTSLLFLASGLLAVWKIWKQGKDEIEKPRPWFRCL